MSEQQNSDTYTKIYVSGLPWTTRNDGLISFFQQFGEILHANVVCDRSINRSQGYGFVTFRDAESATRALANRNPIIEGRLASCRLAYEGRNINNQNQPNSSGLRNDDLCYLSQSFMQQQYANHHQPYPTYFEPYWNQYYQQYNPQPQYVPQGVYSPSVPHGGYPPYVPQGIYPPYIPQGVYPPYVPQGVYMPYVPQGVYSWVYPPYVPQGVYPPYVSREVYPPQAPQEFYPPQAPQEVYSPHVIQRGYPPHVPQRVSSSQVAQEVYPHACSTSNLSAISSRRSLSVPCSTTTMYGQHQSMNVPEENQEESPSSYSSSLSSTQ